MSGNKRIVLDAPAKLARRVKVEAAKSDLSVKDWVIAAIKYKLSSTGGGAGAISEVEEDYIEGQRLADGYK